MEEKKEEKKEKKEVVKGGAVKESKGWRYQELKIVNCTKGGIYE
ncbi:hypothetical protein [Clostridium botulinum]|nr:hypothetical protein [Clostridium botulinum]